MSQQTSTATNDPVSVATARWVALLALLAAAAPHAFLQRPTQMYLDDHIGPWIGLTTWMPTFLAAAAIFCGVDFADRLHARRRVPVNLGLMAAVLAPVAGAVALAWINFDGYQHIGDWSELGRAMALYAAAFGFAPLFWQGLLQLRVLGGAPTAARWLLVTAAGVAIWTPYAFVDGWAPTAELLIEHALVCGLLALVFELGASVSNSMISGALLGAAWAFAHQMTFF